jgi:hypothetical protein
MKRFDESRIDKYQITSEGYLKAKVYATRVGVLDYVYSDGSLVRELRPEKEVFKKESLDSLGEKIITENHPPVFLNSKNTKNYSKGFIGADIKRDGDYVVAQVTITDKDLIDTIMSGKHEVSCGYECDLIKEPGHYNGVKYDVVQSNIIYNHISVVDRGRAGPDARIRLDTNDAMMKIEKELDNVPPDGTIENNKEKKDEEQNRMSTVKIKIDSSELEFDQFHATVVSKKLDELEAVKKEKLNLEGRLDAIKAELEKSKQENEALKQDKLDESQLIQKASGLLKVKEVYEKVTGEKADLNKFDSMELKRKVILKKSGSSELKNDDQSYIDGVFDTIVGFMDKESSTTKLKNDLKKNFDSSSNTEEKNDTKSKKLDYYNRLASNYKASA